MIMLNGLANGLGLLLLLPTMPSPQRIALSPSPNALFLAYPPANHQTTSDRIFLIGTAPPTGSVTVNGQVINRNRFGHFAPTFPLKLGENQFVLSHGEQVLRLTVTRVPTSPPLPTGLTFAPDSLEPAVDVARLAGERVCFAAIAPPNATVNVRLGSQTLPLPEQTQVTDLPPNMGVLTQQNQPDPRSGAGHYQGCTVVQWGNGQVVQPQFSLTIGGQTLTQASPGKVEQLDPARLPVVQVISEQGTARTGPSTDHSRLTPLPKGTRAQVTGRHGDWLRLDYGAWIRQRETQELTNALPPQTVIRSLRAQTLGDRTQLVFPLQVPVPISVEQQDDRFTLTLYNTTAQTDTIRLDDNPLIRRLDWQQTTPSQVQYTLWLKSRQQWGYGLRYDGSTLILSLRHAPARPTGQPLQGITIVLDPGHGGSEDLGARGPTGYPEKAVALTISQLVQAELQRRGATVVMTRTADVDVPLADRVAVINRVQPTLALSLHYNALPDNGDALKTQGISTFWYHPQAHSLAVFLHNYLTQRLKRPSAGVFWNNLALTRPAIAPTVLLELGFMIHPDEFEWIMDAAQQRQLAAAIADGIVAWTYSSHQNQQ